MEIKILQEKENSIKVLMKDTNIVFVNSIRRQIMSGVPVIAIEDVHFYENTGAMHDEMLAQRLGMVPLKSDSKKCKAGDSVKLVLEKDGPCTVYSSDIKSTDPNIEPVDLNIPITKLGTGEKLKLEMDAIVGTGEQHSKWQPAVVSYQEMPVIMSEKGAKDKSYKADMIEILLDEKHRDIQLKEGQHIEYDDTTFIFTIESHGNMSPRELFEAAIDGLMEKAKEFRGELKNLS
ncbi:MAG: DNA-directed RNA polymerase subunit D [Candidatus Diapherotrites archaeon]|uniref:DNA-directed RNA polymerase subunit Rpo3 n=1 Tax=Candidatus Iainarchaeum sp. TaxID=3101447 RepID=A0A8T3YJG8_9ARCH|nr:DNA-directed RNA polymerase subunit D [Candidatus Diapherotrites archaeon]